MTEPDSDDESLFGAGDDNLTSVKPLHYEQSSPEVVSRRQLLQRRMQHLHELYRMYKVEYWGLVEELNSRHNHFLQRPDSMKREGDVVGDGSDESRPGGVKSRPEDLPSRPLRLAIKRSKTAPQIGGVVESRNVSEPAGTAAIVQTSAVPPAEGPAVENPFKTLTSESPDRIGDSVRGDGSDAEPETFSDCEAFILEQRLPASASKAAIQHWRASYRRELPRIQRLEQAASAATQRELDGLGALGALCGRQNRFLVRANAVSLGRATDASQVDINLASEGDARKVSRQQAHLSLQPDGRFWLKNVGRRTVLVNNRQVDQGQAAQLPHLSLIEVGGLRLLFQANHAAVRRVIARSGQLRA